MEKSPHVDHWVTVTTSSGMFSSEYAIALKLASGQVVSFFADKALIKEQQGKSFLKVTLVNQNPAQHKELVLLPTETFETASRWAEIVTE
ncbi:MAG: hypothetical protein HY273_06825 [Gammaproteobacteria bacterium]|nr:hypothetical protein [Gammaproteobacteria bacterium]